MENGKEPITPCTIKGRQGWGDKPTISDREVYGLTKREYFAGLAMQGLMSNPNFIKPGSFDFKYSKTAERVSSISIKVADELLTQLEL